MISAQLAHERLQQGNLRFVSGEHRTDLGRSRHDEMTREQTPFAIVLGCSDSRVPAEIIFDQGLGDLFVIKVEMTELGVCKPTSVKWMKKKESRTTESTPTN